MPETFVQVCMNNVTNITILTQQRLGSIVYNEFFVKPVTTRSFVIGIYDVAYRNALAAVPGAYPVGVRQVNADGCRRVFAAAEHRGADDVGRHAVYLFFLETRVNRGVVFKPLGVRTYNLRAPCTFHVAVFHQPFPCAFHAERVVVNLDEAVDEIYQRSGV